MKTCVIFNPTARGDKARHFREHLAELSRACALKPTTGPGAGRALAQEAVQEGFTTIVAAGGDGTVNEIVNGIGDAPDGFQRAALAVLPLGTVNVFARELGLPAALPRAWRVIQRQHATRIDVGEVTSPNATTRPKYLFVQMAGAGVDALAIGLVDWEQKKKIGQLAYVVAGYKALRGPKPQIVVTNGTDTLTGEQVLIGNGRFYGGSFQLFPQADSRDGLLEVTVLPRANWSALLRGGWNLLNRRLYAGPGVRHLRGKTLELSCPDPMPFHVEAEVVGQLPITCSVRRQALRVLVPEPA